MRYSSYRKHWNFQRETKTLAIHFQSYHFLWENAKLTIRASRSTRDWLEINESENISCTSKHTTNVLSKDRTYTKRKAWRNKNWSAIATTSLLYFRLLCMAIKQKFLRSASLPNTNAYRYLDHFCWIQLAFCENNRKVEFLKIPSPRAEDSTKSKA